VSRSTRARAIAGTVAIASALAACDGTYDLPADNRWESSHFLYLTREADTSVCPDILGPLEENFSLLQSYLGFQWPSASKVIYEKMLDQADYFAHSGCSPDSGGCTTESTVESWAGFHLHELVHAYLWPSGSPPAVLREGVAVTLSCEASADASQKPSLTWDQLASLDVTLTDPAGAYDAGAWLVPYLLEQFGPQKFMTIYRGLASDADAATMDAAFRQVYGQSLESIWAAALALTQPPNVCLWQCSRPTLPLDGTPVNSAGVCGAGDVFAPFTLTSQSALSLSATASFVEVRACSALPFPNLGFVGEPGVGALGLYELPTGSYFLDTNPSSASASGTVAVMLQPASTIAPTCTSQAMGSAALADQAGAIYVAVPSSEPNWFLPLSQPLGGRTGFMVTTDPSSAVSATLCASCDPASCALPAGGPVPWTTGQTLKIETDPTQLFNVVSLF
jgi:hypothetical protein